MAIVRKKPEETPPETPPKKPAPAKATRKKTTSRRKKVRPSRRKPPGCKPMDAYHPNSKPKRVVPRVFSRKIIEAAREGGDEVLYEPLEDALARLPTRASFRERYEALLEAGDRRAAYEFALDTVQQYSLSNVSIDQIAVQLGVSSRTINNWRARLRDREREYIKGIDPTTGIGTLITAYREAAAAGWREAAVSKQGEWARRMRGVEMAMRATDSITKVMQLGGFFDNAPMRPNITYDGSEKGDADALKQLAQNFLSGHYDPETDRKSVRSDETIVEDLSS